MSHSNIFFKSYMRVLVLMILIPFDLFLNKDEKFIDINLLWFTVQVACSCHRLNPIFFNALQFSITLQFDIWYRPLLLNFTLFSASLVISMIFLCARSRFVVLLITVFHHWIISTTQYLTLLLIRKTLNLIPTSTGRSDVLKNRQRGNGEQCTFKLQYKFNMHFFIYKCYVRFHMYIWSKSLYSQLQLSQSLKSACPFVQPIWPNYSNISLHTVCSSYPPLGNCFKTKSVPTRPTFFLTLPKIGPRSKNGSSLSMLLSYTIEKLMEKRFQKVKTFACPIHPKSDSGP